MDYDKMRILLASMLGIVLLIIIAISYLTKKYNPSKNSNSTNTIDDPLTLGLPRAERNFYANSKNRSFFGWLLFFVVLLFYRSKPKSKFIFINLIDFEQIL